MKICETFQKSGKNATPKYTRPFARSTSKATENIINMTDTELKVAFDRAAFAAGTLLQLQKAGLHYGLTPTERRLKKVKRISAELIMEYATRHNLNIPEQDILEKPLQLLDPICSELYHGLWSSPLNDPHISLMHDAELELIVEHLDKYRQREAERDKRLKTPLQEASGARE